MSMQKSQDFKEFIRLLHEYNVAYLIVGGYAYAIHAEPRFTKDLDILIERSRDNGKKILSVLQEFGFGSIDLSVEDIMTPEQVIQLGYAPIRIDLLTDISGVAFSDAWKNKVIAEYDGQKAYFIGNRELIKNKKAIGRPSDLEDVERLQK